MERFSTFCLQDELLESASASKHEYRYYLKLATTATTIEKGRRKLVKWADSYGQKKKNVRGLTANRSLRKIVVEAGRAITTNMLVNTVHRSQVCSLGSPIDATRCNLDSTYIITSPVPKLAN